MTALRNRLIEQDKLRRQQIKEGLIDTVDWYLWHEHDTGILSSEQAKHLYETAYRLSTFGEIAQKWYKEAIKVLQKHNYKINQYGKLI